MNKLLFHEGGQPLHLDDLEFLQEAVGSPLSAALTAFGDCIISGCVISSVPDTTPVHYQLSAGYVALRGKVYKVEAQYLGFVHPRLSYYWQVSESDEELKTFEDGSEHHTQRHCIAKLLPWDGSVFPEGVVASYKQTPRLGEDFARRPQVSATYDGSGRIVEFVELSRYSGVLTFAFDSSTALPINGYFATLDLKRQDGSGSSTPIYNTQGRVTHISNTSGDAIVISLLGGKLSAKWENASTDGSYSNQIRFTSNTKISLFVYWDYEASSGAGSSISAGTGSDYRGVGRSEYGSRVEGSHSRV